MVPTSAHRRRSWVGVMALVLVASLLPAAVRAQEYTAARKFGRGLAGITTGFLEIPGNMYEEGRTNGVFQGATIGLAKGLGMFVSRELVGAYDLLTAPFAVPAGYRPVLAPEFPWEYFRTDGGGDYYDQQAREIERISGVTVERSGNTLVVRFAEELLFRAGSSTLSADAASRLTALARTLQRYPDNNVAVSGHADSTGDAAYNLRLSQDRAETVRAYLTAQGLNPERVTAFGYGETKPVASNTTAVGRRQNRRVEILLQPKGIGSLMQSLGTMTSGAH